MHGQQNIKIFYHIHLAKLNNNATRVFKYFGYKP